MGVACEIWFEVSNLASFGRPTTLHVTLAACVSAGAAACWLGIGRGPAPVARAGLVACAAALWVRLLTGLPEAANHHLWEASIGSLLALLRLDAGEERELLLQGLRWLVVPVLVYAGVQKAVHGLWFQGEVLAYLVATKASFAEVLGPLLGPSELARLRALTMTEGAGPFRVTSPWLAVVSNVAWSAEIACGVGLLVPRVRTVAWMGAVALVCAIELGAREIFFGSSMVGVLLLYARRNLNGPALPAFVVLYLVCLAMVVGVLPRGVFH